MSGNLRNYPISFENLRAVYFSIIGHFTNIKPLGNFLKHKNIPTSNFYKNFNTCESGEFPKYLGIWETPQVPIFLKSMIVVMSCKFCISTLRSKIFMILQNNKSQIMKQAQWQLSTGIDSFNYINFMFPSYNSPLSKKEKKTIKSFLMGNLSNVIILETVGYPCNTSIENFPIRTSNLSKYTWIFNQHSLTFYWTPKQT